MALPKALGDRGRWLLLLAFTLLGAFSWLGLGGASHHLTAGKLYQQLGSPLLRLLSLVAVAVPYAMWREKLLRREAGDAGAVRQPPLHADQNGR